MYILWSIIIDDEEIDVITVNVNEEKLSQDLEFDLWSKIEFEIDSDSGMYLYIIYFELVSNERF